MAVFFRTDASGGDMLLNTITHGAELTLRPPINRGWIVKGTGSNRPAAIEGSDFTLTELDTNFVARYDQYMAFNLQARYVAGETKKLYFRFYLARSAQVAVWGNGNAFSRWFGAGWHDFRLEYYSNGHNAYYIDNALMHAGAVRGIPDFYWSGTQTILFDVGNRGGILPAGYEWY